MKNIKLIKELNESLRELDPFEKALKEAGIEFDLGNDAEDETLDFENGSDDEITRIADHWREEGADMTDDELRDAIGDELEQIEYSPEEISDGIDRVMSMLGRADDVEGYDEEPDVSDEQELADFEQSDEYFGGGDERL